MPLRSTLTRGFAIAALVTLCGTSPALADDGWDSADPGTGQYGDPHDPDHLDGVGNTGNTAGADDFLGPGGTDDPGGNAPARYRGVVTARDGVWLRDQPERGSRRVRFVANGEEVSIYCRATGDPVDGDRVWYLLTDGTWAWGPARDIDTLGRTPRWC
ncbi:SH3 domain-containing protein [Streptomyces hyaluromycini]|uniref:SH3 domain-containing protein n=1 Tax=Streptomyces hyaluromycini TaxID=1377993 RepID=UPI000B5C7F42|nr:SH3 domain-containing protein [Streptomyces hyaluromycini]